MIDLTKFEIYDRTLDRWGRITEVELPFVRVEFSDGPLPKMRIPLRVIGGATARLWWSRNQEQNDLTDAAIREHA